MELKDVVHAFGVFIKAQGLDKNRKDAQLHVHIGTPIKRPSYTHTGKYLYKPQS